MNDPTNNPPSGIELIAAERQRQISAEGWTPEHDDGHRGGELADAAACYADASGAMVRGASADELTAEDPEDEGIYTGFDAAPAWPWDRASFKLSPDPIRNLVKAGALIAAEIDRLQRKGSK